MVSVNVEQSPGRGSTIPWTFTRLFPVLQDQVMVPGQQKCFSAHLLSLMFLFFCPPSPPTTDSENSLLRYLSDDKILVIQEEPLTQKDNKRDTGRRSRKKGKPPGNPSYPISPSVLASTMSVRLEPGQQDVLNFSLAENNTVPLYHVSAQPTPPCMSTWKTLPCSPPGIDPGIKAQSSTLCFHTVFHSLRKVAQWWCLLGLILAFKCSPLRIDPGIWVFSS